MRERKMHYQDKGTTFTICGLSIPENPYTNKLENVDCKKCLKKIKKTGG